MDQKNNRKSSSGDAGSNTNGRTVRKYSRFFALIFIIPFFLTGCLKVASTQPVQSQAQTMAQTQAIVQPPLTAVPAPKPVVGIVSTGKANLRSEPSTDSEILGQALQGDQLVILKADHTIDWHQVEFNGQPAFIHADLIVLEIEAEVPGTTTGAATQAGTDAATQAGTQPGEEVPADSPATGKINTGTVNIRTEADQASAILGRAYGGAILTVTKAFFNAQWHEVEFEGETGYVHVDLLDLANVE